ncbi:hypothetical protein AAG906_031253 [Vitis piasezkii]
MEAKKGESSMVKEVKMAITLRSGKEVDLPTSKLQHMLRNHPLAHECHFEARTLISQLRNGWCFAAAKPPFGTRVPLCSTRTPISQLQNGLRKSPPPRNPPLAAETISKLQKWDAIFFFMFLFSFWLPNGYKMIFKLQNGYENAPGFKMGCETPLWLRNDFPIAPAEETMPPKETTKTEVKILIQPTQEATIDASTPQDPTIT